MIAKETLLTYPDFSKPFHLHTDASKIQLGAHITQDEKPIAFMQDWRPICNRGKETRPGCQNTQGLEAGLGFRRIATDDFENVSGALWAV